MSPLFTHVLLFLALLFAIVVMSSFYADPDDAKAFKTIPRRYLAYVLSCGVVAVVMLVVEHLFAGV